MAHKDSNLDRRRSSDRGHASDVLDIIGLLNVLIHSIHDTAGLRIVSTLIRKFYFPYQCSGFDVIL
jgi:hypothetical protein